MMKENKICFISCVNDQQLYNEALYYIDHLEVPKGYEIECISIENANSMTAGYNKAMGASDAKYKVYMHQDVYIRNRSFINIMLDILTSDRNIGMIGLTGTKVIPVNGICNECSQKFGQVYSTQTGVIKLLAYDEVVSEYEKVQAVDGFIMVTQYDIPWREDIFDGWSFYDISQSLEFMKAGYEVAIPKQEETWVIHEASGSNTGVEFEDYCNIFTEEYHKYIIETFIYDIEKENNILDEVAIVWRNYYVTKTNDKEYVKPIDDYIINKFNLHSEETSDLFDFDKISALEIVNNNKNEFLRYVNNAKNSLHNRNYEEASKWCFEGARYASENHPGFYTSPEMEKILIECAEHVPQSNYKLDIPQTNNKKRKVLHVLSEGYSTGGHTRLVKNWIHKDNESIHSVITTWQINTTPIGLINAAQESGGWAYSLHQLANFIDRASVLRGIAHEWADIVVLHVHMFDPIPIMAFGVEGGPPVLFMNHGDHVFWIGTSIIDRLVNFRLTGEELSITRRGIYRNSILPLPLSLPNTNNNKNLVKDKLGIKRDAIVLLTIASPYKFKSFGKIHYIDILKKVLEVNKDATAIVIGPDNEGIWQKAYKDTNGRLLPLGVQYDIDLYYSIADIYIDSYMFGSVTSALCGGLYGLPIVAMQNNNYKIFWFNDISYDDNNKINSLEDYIFSISKLIKSKRVREDEGKKLSTKIKEHHIYKWNEKLNSIYREVENKIHRIYLNNDFEDKLGNEDLFLALFQSNKHPQNYKEENQTEDKNLAFVKDDNKEVYMNIKNIFTKCFNEKKLYTAQMLGEYLLHRYNKDYGILYILAIINSIDKKPWLTDEYMTEAIKYCAKNSNIILNYIKLNIKENIKGFIDENYIYNKNNKDYIEIYYYFKNQDSFNSLFRKKKYLEALNLYNNFNELKAGLYKVNTVKEFCYKRRYLYDVVEKEQLREVYIPEYFGSREKEKIEKIISPEIYIAEIDNAKIIGSNSIIIVDGHCLYDMAKADEAERYNLRFQSIKNIDRQFAIVESISSGEVIQEAISLVGFVPYNYYHFTFELLSRLQYIDIIERYHSKPLLIDEAVLKIPQYCELLNIVNKYKHPIIPIKSGYFYEVNRLIYPSQNTWMPINIKWGEKLKPQDSLIAKSAIEYIRKSVLKSSSQKGKRKLFITRKYTTNSRLTNEEDVILLFKQYGFQIVYPESMTFREQVELFSQAECVAGATGAAFTNALYCPENAKIICIIPKIYGFYIYSTIAKTVRCHCVFLDAEVIIQKNVQSSEYFKLDLNYCNDCLESLGFKREDINNDFICKNLEDKLFHIVNKYKNALFPRAKIDYCVKTLKNLLIFYLDKKDINKYFDIMKHCESVLKVIDECMESHDAHETESVLRLALENFEKVGHEEAIEANIDNLGVSKIMNNRSYQENKTKKIEVVLFTQHP